jgi:nitrate reductase gamma subunit
MSSLAHWAVYASAVIFLTAVAVRWWRIRHFPLNMRWEIYPIPHEGARSAHGGSKLEETDWWTKKHPPSRSTELRFMLPEMILLKGLFEHNRRLWWRSFPFHFGLYILALFLAFLVLGAGLELGGVRVGVSAGGLGAVVATLTIIAAAVGLILGLAGAAGLLYMRLTDGELKSYSNPSHYFNLLFIIVVEALGLASWLAVDPELVASRAFVSDLLTLHTAGPVHSLLLEGTILSIAVLVAYIPLTHMSHFFVKWFTWHGLRWDDSANVRGGRIELMIQEALAYRVSWSASHIGGDGQKTWAGVATEELPK